MNADAIAKILRDRIDRDGQGVGIAVGISSPTGRCLVNHGLADHGSAQPMTSESILEIGSVTKVFTSILMAEMEERGELRLDEPLQNFLPSSIKVPSRASREITLIDLATHTSGLTRMPADFPLETSPNPYGDYSQSQLLAAVSSTELAYDIGTRYAYSNYGVALLGQALSHRAGCDFDELLEERVIVPLQMHRTSMAPIAAFESSTAVGYNALFEKVPPWYMGASGGAGGLRSTVVDQLRFLEANLNPDDSTLGRALRAVRTPRRPNGQADGQVALGWQVLKDHGELFWHAGATAGFLSFVGVDVERETGAVVLSNTLSIMGITDIGLHLLRTSRPLGTPPKKRISQAHIASESAAVVGQYDLTPELVITVSEVEGRLFGQVTRQPQVEIFSEGCYRYFLKAMDAQLTFHVDPQGRAFELVLTQQGHGHTAKRRADAQSR